MKANLHVQRSQGRQWSRGKPQNAYSRKQYLLATKEDESVSVLHALLLLVAAQHQIDALSRNVFFWLDLIATCGPPESSEVLNTLSLRVPPPRAGGVLTLSNE